MLPRFARWRYFYEMSLERPFIGFGTAASAATFEYFAYDAVSPHNVFMFIEAKNSSTDTLMAWLFKPFSNTLANSIRFGSEFRKRSND